MSPDIPAGSPADDQPCPPYPSDAPLALPAAQWSALCEAYARPLRAYHHIGHIFETLARFREVVEAGPGWRRPAEVWAALLYHDAVYVAARKDNERRSAELALTHFRQWPAVGVVDTASTTASATTPGPFRVECVAAWILLTARHGSLDRTALVPVLAQGDGLESADLDDTLHLLDADMAILGSEPERFAEYDRAIAEEYRGHVPGFLYRRGRRAFFRSLLQRERIYLSDFFHAKLEAQARRNLHAAINGA